MALPYPGEQGSDRDELVIVSRIGRAFHHTKVALIHHAGLRHPVGAFLPDEVPCLVQFAVNTACVHVQTVLLENFGELIDGNAFFRLHNRFGKFDLRGVQGDLFLKHGHFLTEKPDPVGGDGYSPR